LISDRTFCHIPFTNMATVLIKGVEGKDFTESTTSLDTVAPLGVPRDEKRFFFQQAKDYKPDAVATLVRSQSLAHKLSPH
jgi:hypothetical protein